MSEPALTSVYGPVQSWRFGRSLGIDPIGRVSTCSFDCVYCQLGSIEHKTGDRQKFVPTAQILTELQAFTPWNVDVITLSGSGEPTLALNLGEILLGVKELTHIPVGVLTNGSLLTNGQVRIELAIADWVAVKVDGVSATQFQRINRPLSSIQLVENWAGLQQFRHTYWGQLAVQTMILTPWSEAEQAAYIRFMQTLAPDEIQLNTPSRPRPATHEIEARGNQYPITDSAQWLKPVRDEELRLFGDRLRHELDISVRYPSSLIASQPASASAGVNCCIPQGVQDENP